MELSSKEVDEFSEGDSDDGLASSSYVEIFASSTTSGISSKIFFRPYRPVLSHK